MKYFENEHFSTCPIFRPCPIFRTPVPSSDLPGLKTGAPSSDRGLVGRWGRPVLTLGRSEDGAQHIDCWFKLPKLFSWTTFVKPSPEFTNILAKGRIDWTSCTVVMGCNIHERYESDCCFHSTVIFHDNNKWLYFCMSIKTTADLFK